MSYLQTLFESIRFIKHYRERQAQREAFARSERAEERKHQLLLVEGISQRIVDLAREQNIGLVEIAKAQQAQAASFQQWIDGFKIQNPEPLPPISLEQLDAMKVAEEDGLLPPEFQLAYDLKALEKLNQKSLGDFDREGSDF